MQAVVAFRAGHLDLRLNQRRAGCGDRDTGENGPRIVRDRAVDTTAELLCAGGYCGEKQQ